METLQMISAAKMAAVLITLAGSSIMDLKYRRIPDRFWLLMVLGAGPLTVWEMYLRGADESPISFLSLLLPLAGILFVLYGYPELKEALKGKLVDIFFFLFYLAAAAGGLLAFFLGDRELFVEIGVSFVFMLIYFALYSVPIGGTRIIHGGADAKCLIALSALFPWYVLDIPFQTGPFYEILGDIPAMARIFPVSLSVLFNAAVVTALAMFIILPVRNIIKGEFSLYSFTGYNMNVDDLKGAHVWVVIEKDGKKEKKDPTEKLIKRLWKDGVKRVRVSPKIPFILSLTAGFVIHMVIGNIVAALFLLFS
ncbi:MAG: A24 family peptidase C-terminal domain-containing protein [Thermoplasmatota archaeon]